MERRVGRRVVAFQKYIKLQPDDPRGPFELGNSLFNKGKYPLAVDSYRNAIKLKSDMAMAHYNLSRALARTGDTQAAEMELHAARKIDPQVGLAQGGSSN